MNYMKVVWLMSLFWLCLVWIRIYRYICVYLLIVMDFVIDLRAVEYRLIDTFLKKICSQLEVGRLTKLVQLSTKNTLVFVVIFFVIFSEFLVTSYKKVCQQ